MFISHAQNFEDVILMRALKDVQKGFYIDIGAQDPVADSVSLAFYNKGWRGIHVEPNPFYAAKLRSARPDEEVVEAVVGPGSGDSVFYIVGKTGLSTGRPDIVRTYDKSDIHEISVPIISLAQILNGVSGDVQWLKIDVEGMEAAVLESWEGSDIRPWIIVIEATLPNSQKPAHEAWEGMLLSRDYSPVYFDGVNKFYVHKRRPELQSVFGPGPNCFDDFRLDVSSGYIDTRQLVKLQQEHQDAVKQIEYQARELDANRRTADALTNEIVLKNDFLIKHDSELAKLNDQLNKIEAWAKTLEMSAKQLEADIAARDHELIATHSRMVDLSNALNLKEAQAAQHSLAHSAREAQVRMLEADLLQLARDADARAHDLDAEKSRSADRERELESARSHAAELSETLIMGAARSASLEADLIEKNALLQAIYTSSSWRLTAPMRGVGRAARWMAVGTRAWITFMPGSRPRRIARRAARPLFYFIKSRPRLLGLVKAILVLAPPLDRRLRAAIDPMKPFMTLIVPPPWNGSAEHLPLPHDEKLSYRRLIQAAKYAGEIGKVEPCTDKSKPRLAYITPLPPEKSGIADFSAQFLPSLSKYYEIDVITPQTTVADQWVIANCAIRDVAWFEQNAHRYDRILYHFGNSHFHSHMFALLEKIPGVVVLHDFFLSSVLEQLETHGGWKGYWTGALAHSHGYSAIKLRLTPSTYFDAAFNYPANFSVLDSAQGIIVHNEHARKLCADFYPAYDASNWEVLPLAKSPNIVTGREAARARLGLPQNAFVTCSFGFAQSTKLNHRLLDAWLASSLKDDARGYLIFVGGVSEDAYGKELRRNVDSPLTNGRTKITGFVSSEVYNDYLQAADISVQLRTQSRGETSAAVLDCLAHGIPTIINAHGSLSELPRQTTICLQDNFTDSDLTKALNDLRRNEDLCSRIGQTGQKFIEEHHAPSLVAEKYFNAIEKFAMTDHVVDSLPALVEYARKNSLQFGDAETILDHSRELRRRATIKRAAKRILVDISLIVREDYRTGIQRVVRAQLLELLKSPPAGYRIEPVWLHNDFGAWRYRYARNYMLELLQLSSGILTDDPVDVGEGDVFLGADFFTTGVIGAARLGLYDEWRARGVRICFTVYDILPLTLPHRFPTFAEPIHAQWLSAIAHVADVLVCISAAVAVETQEWLASNKVSTSSQLAIVSCPLGADIDASSPSFGLPANAGIMLDKLSGRDNFLMVGTIEPRKGHLQALDAFDLLWRDGVDVNLVIVGARGWKGLPDAEARTIPTIINRLQNHPERGHRLIWLDGISDEYLEKVYAASACLIAASDDEGFGLPLIEAARHNLPVLARDIAVFREVAGDHATYFKGQNGGDLARAVRSWMDLRASGECPESGRMQWLTWKENVERLKEILLLDAVAVPPYQAAESSD